MLDVDKEQLAATLPRSSHAFALPQQALASLWALCMLRAYLVRIVWTWRWAKEGASNHLQGPGEALRWRAC